MLQTTRRKNNPLGFGGADCVRRRGQRERVPYFRKRRAPYFHRRKDSAQTKVRKSAIAAQKETKSLIENALGCASKLDDKGLSAPQLTVFRLEKFPHVCRLCLKPQETQTDAMIPLYAFDSALDGSSVGEFIAGITPTAAKLLQNKQNFLPNSVCLTCLDMLRFFAKYRSKISLVQLLMNSLVELKQFNSSPILDLFKTEPDTLRSVIKDLGLNRSEKFSVEDLILEFHQYDLASFEGFVIKEEIEDLPEKMEYQEELVDELMILPPKSEVIFAEECTAEELTDLAPDKGHELPESATDSKQTDCDQKNNSTFKGRYGGRKLSEPLNCTKCEYSTYFKRNFETHQMRHVQRETRVYACKAPGCSEVFKTGVEYRKHGAAKHKSFICDTCGIRLSKQSDLKTHVARHQNKFEFVCTYCNRGHNTKNDLKVHIQKVHLREARFPCETCGMVFQRKFVLESHALTHSNVYKFPCTMCDKKFKENRKLKRHIVVVHEKVRIPCSHCELDFLCKYKLNNHIENFHGIQTRFVCDVCVLTFDCQDKLDSHRARHDDPKELECGRCLSAFTSEDVFTNHLCITYRDDYVCCGRDLRYHYMYNKHMLMKHGMTTNVRVKPIPGQLMGQLRAARKRIESCPKCDEIFATRTLRKQHIEICRVGEKDGEVADALNNIFADVGEHSGE
ncbi:zinc finger protein 626-like isoform X2 [Armigeres subalbatus]|uniref:zinc finger protein 626-like isoform X2 n=1 Tax=Armigeres subalbatus TaxID=124917 RepID=UPI002ED36501